SPAKLYTECGGPSKFALADGQYVGAASAQFSALVGGLNCDEADSWLKDHPEACNKLNPREFDELFDATWDQAEWDAIEQCEREATSHITCASFEIGSRQVCVHGCEKQIMQGGCDLADNRPFCIPLVGPKVVRVNQELCDIRCELIVSCELNIVAQPMTVRCAKCYHDGYVPIGELPDELKQSTLDGIKDRIDWINTLLDLVQRIFP
ncbi:MAG: hypothetical protein KDD70_08670, partial [Bdellovibrionales bacterium]|nr:hypothetical protein [Bdellovibrionales bacterium]